MGQFPVLHRWYLFCSLAAQTKQPYMKRTILSICTAAVVVGLTACSNSSDGTATGDTTTATPNSTPSMTNVPTTTSTSTGTYAAMADTVERNSTQGYYLNPRTGKPYTGLKVDRNTGAISDEAGEPVYRYVDNRNWWVYGESGAEADTMHTWNQVGEAKMEGEKLTYKGDGDKYVDYNTRYKADDEKMNKKWKSKDGEVKIKTEKDGDMKIKVGDEKIKVDEDGVKKKN